MKPYAAILAAFLSLGVVATACGGDNGTPAPSAAGTVATRPAGAAGSPSASAAASATRPTGSPAASPTAVDRGPSADAFRGLDYPDDMTDGFSLGKADAPLVLTIFEDFQCPHCLQFNVISEPAIVQEFVFTGKVRLEFRNLPILGQESANAAIASQCAADQDLFWPYMKALFLAQYDAGQLVDEKVDVGRFNPDPLIAMAQDAGADAVAFETCLYSDEAASAVTEHLRQANDLGLRATPSMLVNGEHETNVPPDAAAWRSYLNEKLRSS